MKLDNETRKKIYRRDGWRCALCDNSTGIQIHHVIPRGKGGSNHEHNLITLCSTCHGQVHGINMYDDPDFDISFIEQAIVEYLADLYATEDMSVWNPWQRE